MYDGIYEELIGRFSLKDLMAFAAMRVEPWMHIDGVESEPSPESTRPTEKPTVAPKESTRETV